jgi:predicted amidohydrolase
VTGRRVRVAAAQWPIERYLNLRGWRTKLGEQLARAAAQGARLAVVPEYAAMELTALLPESTARDLQAQLAALQELLPAYHEACRDAARAHGLYLVAGSAPEASAQRYVNRLRVWSPSGGELQIEKVHMTRFERESWGISPGAPPPIVETEHCTFGVAICYDSEFPLTVRRLVAAGAELVLVPSCTDSLAGYHRVRVACAARALENQCVVVQSPTVGSAPWSLAVDENHGAAGFFGPPDRGFPDDGVLALGALDRPAWLTCDVDLEAIAAVRRDGAVFNHQDWLCDDATAPAPPAPRVRL